MVQKHSRVGIASFIIAVLAIAGMTAALIASANAAAALYDSVSVGAVADAAALPEGAVGGFLALFGLMFLSFAASLVGCVLGVVGLFQKDKRRLFPVLGLTFNGLLVFSFIAAFFVGAIAGPALPGTV